MYVSGNVANDLLEIINENRTSHKLPKLINNAGLGCIALQYAELCKANCSTNNTLHCQPPEDDFTEIFAPNCGVELPTFGTISGHILGCQQHYLGPEEAYHDVLIKDQNAVSIMRNGTFREVGVGVVGRHKHKGPYIWCVLFSDGLANDTFVLDDLGRGIEQKRGCYSGSSEQCNAGNHKSSAGFSSLLVLLSLHILTKTINLPLYC